MDGILLINKEKEWTSNDIVQKVKKIFNEKTGHAGTLDPLATGVIPILIGKGTKISKYLINHDKEYIATIKLGEKTSTGDLEGEIIQKKEVTNEMLQEEFIRAVLKKFKGKQKQVPPMYSAIKVNGRKLYDYARNNENIQLDERDIEIYDIQIISILEENLEIKYKVSCSKGTYIRTLSENIAEKLGTVGFMKDLQRTQVGEFDISQALTIGEIEQDLEKVNENFITIENFFKNKDKIILDEIKLKKFMCGTKIFCPLENGVYRIYNEKKVFLGIGEIKEHKLKRDVCVID